MTVTCFERREHSKSDGISLLRLGSKKTITSTLLVHTLSRSLHFLSLITKTAMKWAFLWIISCGKELMLPPVNDQQGSEAFSPTLLRMWGMPRATLGSLEMEPASVESKVDCGSCHYPIEAQGRPQSKGSCNLFPDGSHTDSEVENAVKLWSFEITCFATNSPFSVRKICWSICQVNISVLMSHSVWYTSVCFLLEHRRDCDL